MSKAEKTEKEVEKSKKALGTEDLFMCLVFGLLYLIVILIFFSGR
jgi:hypothetical protein|nr:MAG TPA: hypothetical protein [Caudoviricetes sp.]DAV33844.1 MAG TPA: hypothetical protein [Caudoviricetes sp.]